jgi:NADPH2:quinone reductase
MSAPARRAIQTNGYGPPEVMQLTESVPAAPAPGQALVAVRAIGVNYMDLSTRQGYNPMLQLPATLGVEGAGVIEALGEDVADLRVGQRVAWYYVPGSYTSLLLAPAQALVPVPDQVDDDTAASVLMQGLAAQHPAGLAQTGDTVVVHSAAGVGSLLTQLLAAGGVTVIGRVSAPGKAAAATQAGAAHVIVDRSGNFAGQVRALTGGRGVRVVFDGTGADTYLDSLACLAPLGTYAYYGGADGQPDAIRLAELPRSILVCHPVVMDHVPTRARLLQHAAELFDAVTSGRLRLVNGGSYPLDRAAEAHHAIHWRARTGIAAQSWRDHGRWRVREFPDYQASYYRAARHGKPYSQVPGRDLAGTWPDNIGAGEN